MPCSILDEFEGTIDVHLITIGILDPCVTGYYVRFVVDVGVGLEACICTALDTRGKFDLPGPTAGTLVVSRQVGFGDHFIATQILTSLFPRVRATNPYMRNR